MFVSVYSRDVHSPALLCAHTRMRVFGSTPSLSGALGSWAAASAVFPATHIHTQHLAGAIDGSIHNRLLDKTTEQNRAQRSTAQRTEHSIPAHTYTYMCT